LASQWSDVVVNNNGILLLFFPISYSTATKRRTCRSRASCSNLSLPTPSDLASCYRLYLFFLEAWLQKWWKYVVLVRSSLASLPFPSFHDGLSRSKANDNPEATDISQIHVFEPKNVYQDG
jgi:hypothetical protein